MMRRLEQLQTEVQQLTGKVEEQANLIAEMKKSQSTMYSDFDGRMQSLEKKPEGVKSRLLKVPLCRKVQLHPKPRWPNLSVAAAPRLSRRQLTDSAAKQAPAQLTHLAACCPATRNSNINKRMKHLEMGITLRQLLNSMHCWVKIRKVSTQIMPNTG